VSGRWDLPVAEATSRRVLCLPLAHELTEGEIARICTHISTALR
jgi:dTDP-4-amino-4,6-dideoxygalactose transaminase